MQWPRWTGQEGKLAVHPSVLIHIQNQVQVAPEDTQHTVHFPWADALSLNSLFCPHFHVPQPLGSASCFWPRHCSACMGRCSIEQW